MTKNQNPESSLKDAILDIVQQQKPETINQLANLANNQLNLTEHQTLELAVQLENEGKIRLRNRKPSFTTTSTYLLSPITYWFWITISVAVATTIASLTIPEVYPLIYIRQILGVISILLLPGYAFMKALFPTNVPLKTSSETIDTIERIALSMGISIALVPMMGLLLNYTPWGITLTPIVLGLLAVTLTFAILGLLREYYAQSSIIQQLSA